MINNQPLRILTHEEIAFAISQYLNADTHFRQVHDPDGTLLVSYRFIVNRSAQGPRLTCEVTKSRLQRA
jgi:hypothetical protein